MRSIKITTQIGAGIVLIAMNSASYACPCTFGLPQRASLSDSETFCVAGEYANGEFGKFATFQIVITNPKNGQVNEWEYSTEKNPRLGGMYNCEVYHFRTGKNGRGREVKKDAEVAFWDANADYNSCLGALDAMEATARGGGATAQSANFPPFGGTNDSCNPVDVGLSPFVPAAEYD